MIIFLWRRIRTLNIWDYAALKTKVSSLNWYWFGYNGAKYKNISTIQIKRIDSFQIVKKEKRVVVHDINNSIHISYYNWSTNINNTIKQQCKASKYSMYAFTSGHLFFIFFTYISLFSVRQQQFSIWLVSMISILFPSFILILL